MDGSQPSNMRFRGKTLIESMNQSTNRKAARVHTHLSKVLLVSNASISRRSHRLHCRALYCITLHCLAWGHGHRKVETRPRSSRYPDYLGRSDSRDALGCTRRRPWVPQGTTCSLHSTSISVGRECPIEESRGLQAPAHERNIASWAESPARKDMGPDKGNTLEMMLHAASPTHVCTCSCRGPIIHRSFPIRRAFFQVRTRLR